MLCYMVPWFQALMRQEKETAKGETQAKRRASVENLTQPRFCAYIQCIGPIRIVFISDVHGWAWVQV